MVERDVFLFRLLVGEDGVALAERAALAILAGETDAEAFVEQGAEGERFAGRPVDALAGLEHVFLLGELAGDLAVEIEGAGHRRHRLADHLQLVGRDRGLAAALVAGCGGETGPGAFQPIGLVGLVGGRRLELRIQARLEGCS